MRMRPKGAHPRLAIVASLKMIVERASVWQWSHGDPVSITSRHSENHTLQNLFKLILGLCLALAVARLWHAHPEPTPRLELKYRGTLVPDPNYRDPGHLVQQLSTQPSHERRTHPNRITLLDSQGRKHHYRVYYDKRYLDPKDWPPPSAEWD